MRKFVLIYLVSIILLASFLRLWKLGEVPPSPDWDEAALGYNAYSILKTGRDEYGTFFPVVLRSFDDYKPALYAYLAIPSIAFFGLNVFAVRFPSAIFGILTVLSVYFLVKELFTRNSKSEALDFKQCQNSNSQNTKCDCQDLSSIIGLLSAGLLAISPWHLQFSRIAFESNVGLALNVFFVTFFLKGLKKPSFLIISSFFAGLALYVYQSEKIFTPLLMLGLILIFRKELFNISKRYFVLTSLVGFLILLPLLIYTLTDEQVWLRARGVSAFADQTSFLQRSALKLTRDEEKNDLLGLVLDNRRIQYAITAVNGYISHFDQNWLFITGDEARHHAPSIGLLYLWELPFLLIGIYSLIFSDYNKKAKLIIFVWFLIAPIPASVTSGVPHAVRTLNFLPTFQIFTAIGIIGVYLWVKKAKKIWIRFLLPVSISSVLIFNFLYFLNQYFVQQNYFNSQAWQYGYKEAIEEVKRIEGNYQQIVVSNEPHLDQSYMFFLFYLKYDPSQYQKEGGTGSGGFAESHRGFLKYTFRPIRWEIEDRTQKKLYVGRPEDFPENIEALKIIYFLNGESSIKIVGREKNV